jgi:hypothetical protein
MENPSVNGGNGEGRDPKSGRFVKGWKGGPGNPDGKRAQAWRQEFLRTVTPADVRAVVQTLVRLAKAGEPWAIHELFERAFGKTALLAESDAQGQVLPVSVRMDVGPFLAESMRRAAQLPPVPGLPMLRSSKPDAEVPGGPGRLAGGTPKDR